VARLNEVAQDRVDAPLGEIDRLGDVTKAHVRITRHAE
jgi:hypothetical protein